MTRRSGFVALALALCVVVTLAHGQQRGGRSRGSGGGQRNSAGRQGNAGAGQKPSGGTHGNRQGGNQSPGGNWSQRTHGGMQSGGHPGNQFEGSGGSGNAAARKNRSQSSDSPKAATGAAAANRKSSGATGNQGAAAGAAAANRNSPQASGAQGAATGAAAANRNSPQASGAQGAAAGAAAANRNSPQASGALGAAAGAAAVNRNEPQFTGAGGAAAGYAAVRNSFDHPNVYGQQWYGDHPGAWAPSGWPAGGAWAPSTWSAIAGHCGYAEAASVSYNYGVNVTSQDGNVTVDGQPAGTNEEFSQQAADLADSGAPTEPAPTDTPPTDASATDATSDEQWLPLGVFAMVRNENQHPQLIVQLAINQRGILRGNYTDELTDHTQPIHGAVDKTTQRAAWRVGDNQQTVMETGLFDLTQAEASALIHKNGKTDHWILVRLEQPPTQADDAASEGSEK